MALEAYLTPKTLSLTQEEVIVKLVVTVVAGLEQLGSCRAP